MFFVRREALLCDICREGYLSVTGRIHNINYVKCSSCKSIYADQKSLEEARSRSPQPHDNTYWHTENASEIERAYGTNLIRAVEIFLLSRIPVRRLIDIGAGGGYLLDAMTELAPALADIIIGIEPYPPPESFRSKSKNLKIGFIDQIDGLVDGGICIEMIEYLFANELCELASRLASRSKEGALFGFVSRPRAAVDQSFRSLSPFERGSVAFYSVSGAAKVFRRAGFAVYPFPGREWEFLAEYDPNGALSTGDRVIDSPAYRVWEPLEENRKLLQSSKFGHLLYDAASDSVRCALFEAEVNFLKSRRRNFFGRS